jgi:hypothetical protein
MNQNLFKAVKTGCGVALLAATLGNTAMAGSQSFAYSAIFFKGGTTPTYLVNVPAGHRSSDATIVLEIALADAAKNTYTLGYSFGALGATAGETGNIVFAASDINSVTISSVNANGLAQAYNLKLTGASDSSGAGGVQGLWASSYSFYLPGSSNYSMSLQQQLTFGSGASSAVCYVTYTGRIDTDGNYKIPTATGSFSATVTDGTGLSATVLLQDTAGAVAHANLWFLNTVTNATSALAAAQWTSFNSSKFAIYDPLQSGSILAASSAFLKAYSTSSTAVSSANTGAILPLWPTSAAVYVNKMNSCVGVYANRVAINSSGLILGGNNGLARIW